MEEPARTPIESLEETQSSKISSQQQSSSHSGTPVVQPQSSVPKKKRSKMAMLIIMGITFILLVSCATYAMLQIMRNKIDNNPTADAKNTTQMQTSNPDKTRDSAITQSLNDIDTGISSAKADQTSADNAVSDSDQQITVPTE